jgi:hypothetical protein
MLEALQTVAVTLISTGGLIVVGWFTYRSTRKKDKVQAVISKEANAITWNVQLLKRIETLEGREEHRDQRVRELETRDQAREEQLTTVKNDLDLLGRVFGVAVNYIERFLQWAKDGSRPPIPDIPEPLRSHLDPSLIDEHHRQQRAHNTPAG